MRTPRWLMVVLMLLMATACSNTPASTRHVDDGLMSIMPVGLTIRDGGSFGLDRLSVLPQEDPLLGPVLRVRYPENSGSELSAKDDDTAEGGAQAYLVDGKPADELYLRYYVKFPVGFDFVKGGKLPGLYGGVRTSGRRIPDGTNGLSTRYMWRRDGAGEVYAYLPTSREHGTSLGRGNWHFVPGQWTAIEQRVKLNDPHVADGEITVWVNGTQVLHKHGLTFRSTRSLQIDGVFFSSFFGGGDRSWATPRDQYVDFAAFRLSADPVGPAS